MSLKDQITDDMKTAMRARETERLGTIRLLLSAMSENPGELQRFYAETVEPLVAYDEQYETDLVLTLESYGGGRG